MYLTGTHTVSLDLHRNRDSSQLKQAIGLIHVPHWHTHSQFGLAQKPRQFSLAHTQTLTGWICTETMTVHN